ncbi:hypothetical protein BJ944DRAFT_285886 [Cunninghamella echinulata]|nr:hypothetical protein BJ944DRAFT_285886 [Cunninghamella echinulata]
MPRGPSYANDKGFHHHNRQDKNGLERRTSNPYGQPTHGKRFHHDRFGDRSSINNPSSGRREFHRDNRMNNRSNQFNNNEEQSQERLPEWMDYDAKSTPGSENKVETQTEFINDLEAWKSNMKKKNGVEDNTIITTSKEVENEKTPSKIKNDKQSANNMDDLLDGFSTLEMTSSTTLVFEGLGTTKPTFIDPTSASASEASSSMRGSRFAKFFAKREETSHPPSPSFSQPQQSQSPPPQQQHKISDPVLLNSNKNNSSNNENLQPRSISLNDLFNANNATPNHLPSLPQQQQSPPSSSNNPLQGLIPNITGTYDNTVSVSAVDQRPSNTRVLSEDDILQTLGAKKTISHPEQPSSDSNANAMGFNRVLQILSQPKPTVLPTEINGSSKAQSVKNENNDMAQEKTETSNEHITTSASKTAISDDTASISSPKLTADNERINTTEQLPPQQQQQQQQQQSTPTMKSKTVGNLFGGSLPTSVLRQMSARSSSDGRSPSLSSNKSIHSNRFSSSHTGESSQNGSPSIGHASPVAMKSNPHMVSPQVQQQQLHHQPHSQPQQQQPAPPPPHSPSNNFGYHHYSPNLSTSLGVPNATTTAASISMMNDMRSPANGYELMNHQQQRFGNMENGIPPPPPPQQQQQQPLVTMQGRPDMNIPINQMMPPQYMRHQQQQQNQPMMDRSFMPPHPPPPMMGMPPMMPPPPHLPLHLQGQGNNAGNGIPPPFMQPPLPGMPMGMPPQMFPNKNPSWNQQ